MAISSISNIVKRYLYTTPGYTAWIARLTGLVSIPISMVVWWYTHAGCGGPYPGPFNVPTWWMGDRPLDLPLPPEPVNILIFAIFNIFAIAMVLNRHRPFMPLLMSMALAYCCSRDYLIASWHWILLDFIFLFALGLATPGRKSPTRRIIQIAIVGCYLFGVMHRALYPDFLSGLTFKQFFADGFACNDWCKSTVMQIASGMSDTAWQAMALITLVGEVGIGLGLCFKRTRMMAVILGLILHLGITVVMEPLLLLFTIDMFVGYLAFFDGKGDEAVEMPKPGIATNLRTMAAIAMIALEIAIPLRIYWPNEETRDWRTLTLFARAPWSFGMFILRQEAIAVHCYVDDKPISVPGGEKGKNRFDNLATDNEMKTAARYLLSLHPEAKNARVETVVVINGARTLRKATVAVRGK